MAPGTVCDRQELGFFPSGLMVDASGWLVTSDGLLFLFCFWNAKGYFHYLNLIVVGLINLTCS